MFADYAFERFLEKGYTPEAAAAIVGAFQQESGMDLDPTAVHDDGTGMGIAGWRDPEPGKGRRTNLLNWAEAQGLDPNDIDTQLDYFDYEINEGEEKGVGDLLRNATTLEEAADAMVHYERPQGYDQSDVTKANGYENRVNNAKALFSSYTGEDLTAQPTETHDTAPMPDEAEEDIELIPYAEDDEELAEDYEDFKDEGMDRVGKGIQAVGRQMREQAEEPFDYTPAGENTEIAPQYESGIPLNAYQQFTSLYADGGVVGENDIDEYFKSLGV